MSGASDGSLLRAYLVDDEPLAIRRLTRLLQSTGRVEISGSSTDPEAALQFLRSNPVDVLFLDIEMPGMNGFELAARLERQPFIVFTTAFDRYALKAFEVNSIDYLLKPIELLQLERALGKLERIGASGRQEWIGRPDIREVLDDISRSLKSARAEYVTRIPSRLGERTLFLEVPQITHFLAEDKLTYAVVRGRRYCVDSSIAELERRLDPRRFVRIHRSTLLNVDWIQELDSWVGGGVLARLKDEAHTELEVARDRARHLRKMLGS